LISHTPDSKKEAAGSGIDPAHFLHEYLEQGQPARRLLRELLEGFVNALLYADADRV
jgi:hypothetical protein